MNHSVITQKFNSFIEKARLELGIEIDERAIKIFESYLSSFSFNNDIDKKQVELLKKIGIKGASIPWVQKEELLAVGSNPDTDRIGVPQGGALSCLIANLILDSVDRQVFHKEKDIFYARFCDDMVLMHPDKGINERVFHQYQQALVDVKLICHKPTAILLNYNLDFWKMKSKAPYKWDGFVKGNPDKENNVPWLSFVGYQIRYDNILRIRKTSIEKELKKQVTETDKIISIIRKSKKANINEKAIIFRLHQRLISMAVGRMQMNNKELSMCWSAGFNVIKENPKIEFHFAKLDKNREKQIKRMIRFIKGIPTPKIKSSKTPIKQLRYYGSKYSYHEQFI